jgi:hypothetical protein
MQPMNVLVVERGADWNHWDATKHVVGPAMLVLAQQHDESAMAFRERIQARIRRLKKQPLNAFVVLRACRQSQLTAEMLLQELDAPPSDVRSLPARSEWPVLPSRLRDHTDAQAAAA